ncbi:hypothetical protein AB0J55_40480 [Amycolatopsis sp. NPDC049688]|uniref:hypothetical protein n=1 Tax=Amycolatopsis sp. NPDC049688 TaxID=3154733 RepID=UPI0034225953
MTRVNKGQPDGSSPLDRLFVGSGSIYVITGSTAVTLAVAALAVALVVSGHRRRV